MQFPLSLPLRAKQGKFVYLLPIVFPTGLPGAIVQGTYLAFIPTGNEPGSRACGVFGYLFFQNKLVIMTMAGNTTPATTQIIQLYPQLFVERLYPK